MPLKVLHFLSGYYPTRGGIETLVDSVVQEMEESFDLQVALVAPRYWNSRPDKFIENCRPIYSVDNLVMRGRRDELDQLRKTYAVESIKRLEIIFEEFMPDLIHIHGTFELFSPAHILAKRKKTPFIHHIHGELTGSIEPNKRALLAVAPCVVAVSERVAKSIRSIVNNSKIYVVPNAIRDLGEREPIARIRKISLVGRLEAQKGFDIALQALSEIIKMGFRVEINVVGIGDHIYLQKLARKLMIEDLVYFFGRCDHSKTMQVIQASDLVLVPSTSIEGFSIVAAEANCSGIPVIASDVGGLPHTIQHGETGIIVPPSDVDSLKTAILIYLNNPSLAQKHGLAGRKRVLQNFSIKNYASSMYEIYQKELLAQFADKGSVKNVL